MAWSLVTWLAPVATPEQVAALTAERDDLAAELAAARGEDIGEWECGGDFYVPRDSDDGVRAFVVARYGDYVLLRPPFNPATWALWLGPPLIVLVAGIAVAVWLRRRPTALTAAAPLTEAERARLDRLVRGDGV